MSVIADKVLLALNSGFPVTLTAEEAQTVYDELKAIRQARVLPNCAKCGKPVGPPTNRHMAANIVMGDRVWHGYCAPSEVHK